MHAPTPPQAPVPLDPIRGRLRHTAGSRTRIALDRPLPDRTGLTRWAEAFSALTGVRAIDIRVTTGSLVLHHEGRFEPIARAAAEAGLLVLHPAEATPSLDPMRETALRLGRMDARVARLTHGRIDLWGLGYTALVMAGLVQLARGRVAGPAVTLFGQAATLVLARSLREPVPGRDGPRTD